MIYRRSGRGLSAAKSNMRKKIVTFAVLAVVLAAAFFIFKKW